MHAEEITAARPFVDRALERVMVGALDVDGILRGKYLSRDKFLGALDTGLGSFDVGLRWKSSDPGYDNADFTGWHSGHPDERVRDAATRQRAEREFRHAITD